MSDGCRPRGEQRFGPNLVKNGNMEIGNPPSGWLGNLDAVVLTRAADQATGGTGTYSLDLAISAGQTTGTAGYYFPMISGKRYQLTCELKNIDVTEIDILIYDGIFNPLLSMLHLTPTPNTWTEFSINFAGANGGWIMFCLHGIPDQHARFDDVAIRSL